MQPLNTTRPVTELLHALRNVPAAVLWSNSYFAEYGETFDVFYSFCKLGTGYISLHGEMPMETFHERRKEHSKIAELYLCEYEPTPDGLKRTRKESMGLGADPRLVSDGVNAYGYVIGYGEARHPAFLFNADDESLKPLEAPAEFEWGKNWQPFMRDGRLFVVHELSPFSIYEIDPRTARLTPVLRVESDFDLPAHNTNHTMFRGGANAVAEGDFVYGIGRASAQSYRHAPFLWSSHKGDAPILQFTDFFNVISNRGFSVVDPTCFFQDGNNYYICLACSETCWFHKQNILNLLLVLDPDQRHPKLPSLEETLTPFPRVQAGGKVNLRRHVFHCDRMQHGIPLVHEYGVQSMGRPGALVYGPYIKIEEGLRLKVELAYLTLQSEGEIAGTFDINLSRLEADGRVEFIQAAECILRPTDKDMNYASLYIDTKDYIGYQIEFRVFAATNFQLNAFHIRIKEVGEKEFSAADSHAPGLTDARRAAAFAPAVDRPAPGGWRTLARAIKSKLFR